MTIRTCVLASALLTLIIASAPAAAVDEDMETAANATANCQGALPNFEGSIRKRPLGVQNEGTALSFVTCSFSTEYDVLDIAQISYLGAFFSNSTASPVTVTCTAVAGFEKYEANVYISKSVSVPANAPESTALYFQPGDNGGQGYYPIVSMSCALPPGVGIHDTYVGYVVDDA